MRIYTTILTALFLLQIAFAAGVYCQPKIKGYFGVAKTYDTKGLGNLASAYAPIEFIDGGK